jgi:hypothetical protein
VNLYAPLIAVLALVWASGAHAQGIGASRLALEKPLLDAVVAASHDSAASKPTGLGASARASCFSR